MKKTLIYTLIVVLTIAAFGYMMYILGSADVAINDIFFISCIVAVVGTIITINPTIVYTDGKDSNGRSIYYNFDEIDE